MPQVKNQDRILAKTSLREESLTGTHALVENAEHWTGIWTKAGVKSHVMPADT